MNERDDFYYLCHHKWERFKSGCWTYCLLLLLRSQ